MITAISVTAVENCNLSIASYWKIFCRLHARRFFFRCSFLLAMYRPSFVNSQAFFNFQNFYENNELTSAITGMSS